MRTFVIEGPLEEVTIKVRGQSLTLTEGVEVTVIVVVASQQERAVDETICTCEKGFEHPQKPGHCGVCGKPFHH